MNQSIKKVRAITCVMAMVLCTSLWSCKNDETDRSLPVVNFISPVLFDDGPILRNVTFAVSATASGGKGMKKVEFHVDGEPIPEGTDTEAPYEVEWECPDRFGEIRRVTATAYDDEGFSSTDTLEVRFFNGVEKAPMPTPRYDFTSHVVNGKIYVIGGHDFNFRVVEEYDPATDTWTAKTPSDFGHASHAGCVLDDIIYVFGGGDESSWTNNVEAYDPATDTWETREPIPSDSGASIGINTAAPANGKIYLMGGLTGDEAARVAEYDPVADSWRMMNTYRREYNAGAVSINNTIYFMGGCPVWSMGHCDSPRDSLFSYNPLTDTWTARSVMPVPHNGHSATVFNGKIYVMGGVFFETELVHKNFEVYDPATDTWTVLPHLPDALINFGSNTVNDKIYIIGPERMFEYTPD